METEKNRLTCNIRKGKNNDYGKTKGEKARPDTGKKGARN